MGCGVFGRRQFVATTAGLLAGTTSGCSAISDWTEEQGQREQNRTPRLCRTLEFGNYDSNPHVFRVLVERDGEVMRWWESDEIPPNTVATVELGSWHRQRGEYTIYGSYDEYRDWSVNDLSDVRLEENEACVQLLVRIIEGGDFDVTAVRKTRNEYPTTTSNTTVPEREGKA